MTKYELIEKLADLLNIEIVIDTLKNSYSGLLCEIGKDYLLIKSTKHSYLINLNHVISIKEREV